MGRVKLLGLSVLAGAVFVGPVASAATVLVSASGPTATYGGNFDFTQLGSIDYVNYNATPSTVGTGVTSAIGDEKTGNTLFGDISIVNGAGVGSPYLNKGGDPLQLKAPPLPTMAMERTRAQIAASAGNIYARGATVGDGVSFTYTLAAGTDQDVSVYLEGYDSIGSLSLTSASSGSLFSQGASGVPLPASDGTAGTPGSGHGAAVYTFELSNADLASDTLTFSYVEDSTAGGSSSVGFQGATVSSVPEPLGAAMIGFGGLGLLLRRRRSVAAL